MEGKQGIEIYSWAGSTFYKLVLRRRFQSQSGQTLIVWTRGLIDCLKYYKSQIAKFIP